MKINREHLKILTSDFDETLIPWKTLLRADILMQMFLP